MLSRELASQVHDLRDQLLETDLDADSSGLIDLIAALEDLKSTACATQARATVFFDTVRRVEEAVAGVPARRQGRGVAAEVALARKVSPHRGRVLTGLARMLCTEMPHTLDRLGDADLDEHKALVMVRETACLNAGDRAVWTSGSAPTPTNWLVSVSVSSRAG